MRPLEGRELIRGYSKALAVLDISHGTRRVYIGRLQRLFDYVLENPYVPGPAPQPIFHKYGRIEQPVTKWDYPAHVSDPVDEEGFALIGDELLELYDFVRTSYLKKWVRKTVAGRAFTMLVVACEGGMRADELKYVDAFGEHPNLNYSKGFIQIRHGKGTNGSGKRLRKTIFTDYSQAVTRHYIQHVQSKFPGADTNPALLLSETGRRLCYNSMKKDLSHIMEAARVAGFNLPPRVGMHTLRKWFASNILDRLPERLRDLMIWMGHSNFSTLNRYILPRGEDLEEATGRVMRRILPARVVEG